MPRKRLFAVAVAFNEKSGSLKISSYSTLAITLDEAISIAQRATKDYGEGRQITASVAQEVSDEHLRVAYDGLFLEKGGWR